MKELAIEERARADGDHDLPPSTEEALSGTQREIVSHFNELQRRAQRRAAALVDRTRACRERIDLGDAAGELREIVARCEDDILRLNTESQARISLLEERARQQRQHYEEFRNSNGLSRLAEYPSSQLLYLSLLVALAGLFVAALTKVSAADGGAPIPLAWAVSIASAAGFVPFLLGATLFRYINHASPERRSAGRLGGTLALLFLAALGMFVACYVEAQNVVAGMPLHAMVERVFADPLMSASAAAASSKSWMSFAMVAMLGLLAWWIGYKSDDPYPGYGSTQRAFYGARRQRELFAKRLRRRIGANVDKAKAQALGLSKRLKAEVKRHARLVEEVKHIPIWMKDYNGVLEDACNSVLDRYRALNSAQRHSATPTSFAEQTCFGREPSPLLLGNEEERAQELERGIAQLDRDVAETRLKLKELYWAAVGGVTPSGEAQD